MKEIVYALMESDVNVRLVGSLRENVRKAVNIQELPAGINKRKLIQKVRILSLDGEGQVCCWEFD